MIRLGLWIAGFWARHQLKMIAGGILLALAVGLVLLVRGHFQEDARTRAKLASTEKRLDEWVAYGRGEKAAYDYQAGQRSAEARQAVAASTRAGQICEARVAEARRSNLAIRSLINAEPKRDAGSCPVRGAAALMDSGSVRDALGARPAGPGGR